MNPAVSVWEKNPYRLWPAPDNATQPFRESFERALGWANEGLWSSAASAFELLAAGSGAGAIADRNRGLCCLWIADHEGAVAALRRYIARAGATVDASRPRGPVPENRTTSAPRSSGVRAPELADPKSRWFAGRAARQQEFCRRRPLDLSIPTIPSRPRSHGSSCSIVPRSSRKPG